LCAPKSRKNIKQNLKEKSKVPKKKTMTPQKIEKLRGAKEE
jgi:hypothetical protein